MSGSRVIGTTQWGTRISIDRVSAFKFGADCFSNSLSQYVHEDKEIFALFKVGCDSSVARECSATASTTQNRSSVSLEKWSGTLPDDRFEAPEGSWRQACAS